MAGSVRTMDALRETPKGLLLRVRVQPRASRNELRVETDGRVRVALTAPAVENAANTALREFLAGRLGIAKGRVSLESGATSREKTLCLAGVTAAEARERLGLKPCAGEA